MLKLAIQHVRRCLLVTLLNARPSHAATIVGSARTKSMKAPQEGRLFRQLIHFYVKYIQNIPSIKIEIIGIIELAAKHRRKLMIILTGFHSTNNFAQGAYYQFKLAVLNCTGANSVDVAYTYLKMFQRFGLASTPKMRFLSPKQDFFRDHRGGFAMYRVLFVECAALCERKD